MTHNNAIGIDYSDQRLRVLVEEYITQQRGTISLQGACAYDSIGRWKMATPCPLRAPSTRAISCRLPTASV